MEVLEYLKTHSLSDLEKEHGIKVKVYDGFVGLNYSMIDSVKSDPITIECRSLKLQKLKDGFSIASRSFDRFFNYGEMPDKYKHFDFSNALVMEKADGSIIPIWYNRYNSTWEISSRSAIFGESLAPNNITYRQSVLDTVGLTEEEFQNIFKEKAKEDFTYIFEYISPANQIVTLYERNEIVLLGIHHNHTGQYLSIKDMELFLNSLSDLKNVKNTRMPKILKCNSFKEVIEAANRLEKLQEGFVCWDYFNDLRVKVKSKKYVALHHMKLGFGERNLQTYNMKGNNFEHVENIITIVLSGEKDEVVAYFPSLKDKLEEVNKKMEDFSSLVENTYNSIKHIANQKDFAKEAIRHPFYPILFASKKRNTLSPLILEQYLKYVEF